MHNFINNTGTNDLKTRLLELIQHSVELRFLVGFFYFSGINELYTALKANPQVVIKVLVGLNVDYSNYGLIECADNEQLSDDEKTHRFFASLLKSINTEEFDTQEFYTQVRFFIELIQQNRLIIRKTYQPNHAKLYLFQLELGQVGKKQLFITGSSNLTRAGLSTQNEFNVEIGDYGYDDAERYFESLWDTAVRITEYAEVKKRLIEVIEKDTLVKVITPFEAFVYLLNTYLDTLEGKDIGDSLTRIFEENNYKPYCYQFDAVRQALAIIEEHNGVIVADVVGLGKTLIACAIANQLNKKRGIVICPPALVGDSAKKSGWRKYLEEFHLYDWEARSLGDLKNTLEFVQRAKNIEVVIIDEAHRFRNQDTQDYELLKNICRNKQVILLTATPFNNRPNDILSLLKLFVSPKKSSITLGSNLVYQFQSFKGTFDKLSYIRKYWNSTKNDKRAKAQSYYIGLFGSEKIDLKQVSARAKYLARQIRDVIKPVTIRRNRLDLLHHPDYQQEVKELSEVAPPAEWFYELTKIQSDFYSEIIEHYFGDQDEGARFQGAIYRPYIYEKGLDYWVKGKMNEEENRRYQQQRNLFDFMRRLLVKRFESSFGAFAQSIHNFKRVAEICLDFIEQNGKYILDRTLLEKIYAYDEEDILTELEEYARKIKNGEYPKHHKIYTVKEFVDRDKFIQDIRSDINLFGEILDRLEQLDLVNNDPKSACLLVKLNQEFAKEPESGEPKRKIIIFSEYVDTVRYLEKLLKPDYGGKMLVVAGDLPGSRIGLINRNFDASYIKQENDYELLLTTDKLSEGFNLNRAGMVINYDIPWNPVRVIQRLGRINRISKKVFSKLYIVNFFPTEQGAELVQSREIAANKMFLIHNALGEDARIFDVEEEPSPAGLYTRIQQNPENLEEESFDTKAMQAFADICKSHPEMIAGFKNYPPRIKVAKASGDNELLVFYRKGRLYVHVARTDTDNIEPYPVTFEDVYSRIECAPGEQGLHWNTGRFWEVYQGVQDYRDDQSGPVSERSLERQALNKLEYLLASKESCLLPYRSFLRTLREDILNYGTLAEYTLRRISNLEPAKDGKIEELLKELGEDYLNKEKQRLGNQKKKELIIVVNNIKG